MKQLNKLVYIFALFFGFWSVGQDQKIIWTESFSKPIHWNDVWCSDGLGNVIRTNRTVIEKYDTTGSLMFSQSIRAIGKSTELTTVNSMKILSFSDEQQTLCSLDNTLTLSENCIDLADFNIQSAIHVSASSQPDRIWIMDQLNYHLMSLNLRTGKYSEISNLTGILNFEQVDEMKEYGNELFILDRSKGLYRFDLYGTLISYFPQDGCLAFAVQDGNAMILKKDGILMIDMESEEEQNLHLPIPEIIDFSVNGSSFYFRTVDKIFRYKLSLNK